MNPKLTRRCMLCTTALGLTSLTALVACGDSKTGGAIVPAEIDAASTCELDGMLLADYPGPKAQIHYVGESRPIWCCDTMEMFSLLLKPEQVRAVAAVFVQDMAQADWAQPRGHWFDARQGHYVIGSKRHGSMGPTVASFRQAADAQAFMQQHGGRVVAYAEVTAEMVDLSGGAHHDGRM